ncbi:MAG TPA: DUF4760 domain-containing protein [Stellaceae bacterium]|nr:DUF4760 domain-containing protein [Stellaceae bacterium]
MPETAIWFLVIVVLLFATTARVQYPRLVKLRYFFYALVLALASAGFYLDFRDLWGDPHQEWQITVLLGSSLIVLGWIFTNEMAIYNSRKQHTISLITQLVTSGQRVRDMKTIRKSLPRRAPVTQTAFDYTDEAHPLAQAIDRELNFLEFIAIGVNSGDLEETMTKKMLSGVVIFFVGQVRDYIDFWRRRDRETWQELCALYDRWNGPPGR